MMAVRDTFLKSEVLERVKVIFYWPHGSVSLKNTVQQPDCFDFYEGAMNGSGLAT